MTKIRNSDINYKILELNFELGKPISSISKIDKFIYILAQMHVSGIKEILKLKEDFRSTNFYSNYYGFCNTQNILTQGDFIIGDHNPNNYLIYRSNYITRIDLGSFQIKQPIVLDLYLLLYHIHTVYEYNENPIEILKNYFKAFCELCENQDSNIRNHIGRNFETFKKQVDIYSKYIDKKILKFEQYYFFLKYHLKNFDHIK